MWNNHQALNLLSMILFTLVTIAILYAIGLQLIKPPLFPIKEINIQVVNGTTTDDKKLLNVTHEQIEDLARNEIKGNFISVDLTEVRKAFVKLPWVRDAKINRQWPHGLNVMLEEHQALAYWGESCIGQYLWRSILRHCR